MAELHFVRDGKGRYRSVLFNHRSSVQVLLNGAQIISWRNHRGEELLVVNKDDPSPPKPVGIQICFPVVPDHGLSHIQELARHRLWRPDKNPPSLPTCSLTHSYVDLTLRPTEEDLKIWPHRFEYRLRVALLHSGDLTLISRIRNVDTIGGNDFSFKFAYRNYLHVSRINKVRVEGLGTLMYHVDNLEDRAKILDQVDTVTFESEVDKVFLNTPSKICVVDPEKKGAVIIHKEGLPDVGVWNPWKEEHEKMVCIEAGALGETVTLKPAEEWRATLELSQTRFSIFE